MKVKTKRVFTAFLLFALAFCSRPQMPSGKQVNQEPVKNEPYVSVLFPRSTETFRKMSESEIHSKFQSLMHYIMSDPEMGETRSVSELSEHVSKSIDSSSYASSIVDEFYQNGIYLAVKQNPSENQSRYGDADHKLITGTKTYDLLKTILEKTNDWEAAHQAMQNIPLEDKVYTLADLAALEDHIDPVFFPMDSFKISVFIDINGSVKFRVKPIIDYATLGLLSAEISGNPGGEFEIGKTIDGEMAQQALEGLITLSHFWNPDEGWNSGNTNAWGKIQLNGMTEPFDLAKAKDFNVNGIADLDWYIQLLGDVEFTGTAKAQLGTDPNYIIDWLQNPPSAYFKALCYWHGWTELVWKQKQDQNRKCKVKGKFAGITVSTRTVNCGKTYSEIKEMEPQNFEGILDYIKGNDTGMAFQYLARVLHLLQDMTVPCHAHNDPHGAVEMATSLGDDIEVPNIPGVTIHTEATARLNNISFHAGGQDMWEAKILKSDLIKKIVNNNSYRFEVQSGNIAEASFGPYSSKQPNIEAEKNIPGSFFHTVNEYSKSLEGTYSLFSLFFNAAQAAQYFPTIKVKPELNTSGLYNVPGNQKTFSDYHSLVGEFRLGGTPGLTGENYNDTSKYDTYFTNMYTYFLEGRTSLEASEKGTYYLVYTGEDAEETERFKSVDYARARVSVAGSGNLVTNGSDYKLYYLGYPYNKMAETLVPLAVAASSRLLRNYFRFTHQ